MLQQREFEGMVEVVCMSRDGNGRKVVKQTQELALIVIQSRRGKCVQVAEDWLTVLVLTQKKKSG